MVTSWLWRAIRPKSLAAAAIIIVWAGALALLWFYVYPALGPLEMLSPDSGVAP